jgi:hypothetical protein
MFVAIMGGIVRFWLPPDGGVYPDYWRGRRVATGCADFQIRTPQNTNFHRFLHRCGNLWEETEFHTPHGSPQR